MGLINQYSIVWSSLIIIGLAAFLLLRKGLTPWRVMTVIGIGVVILGGWLAVRPDPASTDDLNQFQAELGYGQAVLLELQSPY
jgi:hypothetical protein